MSCWTTQYDHSYLVSLEGFDLRKIYLVGPHKCRQVIFRRVLERAERLSKEQAASFELTEKQLCHTVKLNYHNNNHAVQIFHQEHPFFRSPRQHRGCVACVLVDVDGGQPAIESALETANRAKEVKGCVVVAIGISLLFQTSERMGDMAYRVLSPHVPYHTVDTRWEVEQLLSSAVHAVPMMPNLRGEWESGQDYKGYICTDSDMGVFLVNPSGDRVLVNIGEQPKTEAPWSISMESRGEAQFDLKEGTLRWSESEEVWERRKGASGAMDCWSWVKAHAKKHCLTLVDLANLQQGGEPKEVLLLHANWCDTVAPDQPLTGNDEGVPLPPTTFFRGCRAVYHAVAAETSDTARSKNSKEEEGALCAIEGFDLDVEISEGRWVGLVDGKLPVSRRLGPLSGVAWEDLPTSTRVGVNGCLLLWDDVKHLPNVGWFRTHHFSATLVL